VRWGELREKGRGSTIRYIPWPEDVVRGFVGVVFGKILARVLLGEGPFETSERIWVEEIVRVVWLGWWVVWHSPVGRGWGSVWGGGSFHGERKLAREAEWVAQNSGSDG